MDANSAQFPFLRQFLPRCVLRLGPSILTLKATSDLDGETYNDKSETLALGLSLILLHYRCSQENLSGPQFPPL